MLVCAYCSACADLCDSGPESPGIWLRGRPTARVVFVVHHRRIILQRFEAGQ